MVSNYLRVRDNDEGLRGAIESTFYKELTRAKELALILNATVAKRTSLTLETINGEPVTDEERLYVLGKQM